MDVFFELVDLQAEKDSLVVKIKHVNKLLCLLKDFKETEVVNSQFLNDIVNNGITFLF
jgi:hypothetical protein